MPKKRVIILQDGELGADYYKTYVETLKRVLESVKDPDDDSPMANVEIKFSRDEVKEVIAEERVHVVIFVSASLQEFARTLRKEFKELVVFVVAGRSVQEEPYLIPKGMLELEGIQKMLRVQ